MKNLYNIMATFFINELTVKLLPTPKDDVNRYIQQLDAYSTLITGFIGQHNEAYEAVNENLINFVLKYKVGETKKGIMHSICAVLCPPVHLGKFSPKDRDALFRKFICASLRQMVTLILSYSKDIIALVNNASQDELRKFRIGLVAYFEDILNETQQNIYIEFTGGNNGEVRKIKAEQKIISELRKQNEDLQFQVLKLSEEVQKLRRELALSQQAVLPDEDEEEE